MLVYYILIADHGFYGGFGYSGYSAMSKLTSETGGRLIDVGNNGKKLEDAFQQIEDELRTEYVATYTPTNPKLDGSFRKLAVECGNGNKVCRFAKDISQSRRRTSRDRSARLHSRSRHTSILKSVRTHLRVFAAHRRVLKIDNTRMVTPKMHRSRTVDYVRLAPRNLAFVIRPL